MSRYHLAQVNIAALDAPLDSDQLADFVRALEPVNAVADRAPGFVWRLQTESGDSTSVAAFAAEETVGAGIVTNLSTWVDLRSLTDFVYGPDHRELLRRRREWFLPIRKNYAVCWWVPAHHYPTTDEAEERLAHLRAHGSTPHAFTASHSFAPPTEPQAVLQNRCP